MSSITAAAQPAQVFTILYFASASSYTKKVTEYLPAPLPVNKLFGMLEERYPGINAHVLSSCAVTVGLEYVDLEAEGDNGNGERRVIQAGEEVGIIPPVSSG